MTDLAALSRAAEDGRKKYSDERKTWGKHFRKWSKRKQKQCWKNSVKLPLAPCDERGRGGKYPFPSLVAVPSSALSLPHRTSHSPPSVPPSRTKLRGWEGWLDGILCPLPLPLFLPPRVKNKNFSYSRDTYYDTESK